MQGEVMQWLKFIPRCNYQVLSRKRKVCQRERGERSGDSEHPDLEAGL